MQKGQCQCGHTQFTIEAEPLVRAICHCTICQEFNQAPYGDVCIFLAKDVSLKDKATVNFRTYKAPPAINRGKCAACDTPAIELLDVPVIPAFTILPSINVPPGRLLPAPSLHIFYHRRIAEIDDELPKYSGFVKSQLVLSAKLFHRLLFRNGSR